MVFRDDPDETRRLLRQTTDLQRKQIKDVMERARLKIKKAKGGKI